MPSDETHIEPQNSKLEVGVLIYEFYRFYLQAFVSVRRKTANNMSHFASLRNDLIFLSFVSTSSSLGLESYKLHSNLMRIE